MFCSFIFYIYLYYNFDFSLFPAWIRIKVFVFVSTLLVDIQLFFIFLSHDSSSCLSLYPNTPSAEAMPPNRFPISKVVAENNNNNNNNNNNAIFMSLCMRKPTICICETKGADQRLCFRYTDGIISHLLNSKISSF